MEQPTAPLASPRAPRPSRCHAAQIQACNTHVLRMTRMPRNLTPPPHRQAGKTRQNEFKRATGPPAIEWARGTCPTAHVAPTVRRCVRAHLGCAAERALACVGRGGSGLADVAPSNSTRFERVALATKGDMPQPGTTEQPPGETTGPEPTRTVCQLSNRGTGPAPVVTPQLAE